MEAPQPIIAVVEDDGDTAEMLEALFTRQGATVVCVSHTTPIVEHLQAAHPDLVILDMELGATDGLIILAEMRQADGLGQVPVIFFTGVAAVVQHKLPWPLAPGVQLVAKPHLRQLIAVVRASLPSLA